MSFEDIVAVLGQAFGLELKLVQDTTVFEVVSDDGRTKVQILLQDSGERNLVLIRRSRRGAAGGTRKAFPDDARGQQHVFRNGRLDACARRRLRKRQAPAVHAGRRSRKQCHGNPRAVHRDGAPLEPHDRGLPPLR